MLLLKRRYIQRKIAERIFLTRMRKIIHSWRLSSFFLLINAIIRSIRPCNPTLNGAISVLGWLRHRSWPWLERWSITIINLTIYFQWRVCGGRIIHLICCWWTWWEVLIQKSSRCLSHRRSRISLDEVGINMYLERLRVIHHLNILIVKLLSALH